MKEMIFFLIHEIHSRQTIMKGLRVHGKTSLGQIGQIGRQLSCEIVTVSMAILQVATTKGTVTLTRSVEYLSNRYLPELGVWEGKLSIIASKEAMLSQHASKHKATTWNSLLNSGWPPNQSKGQQLTRIIVSIILSFPKFHFQPLLK